jgi:hypothetical protein
MSDNSHAPHLLCALDASSAAVAAVAAAAAAVAAAAAGVQDEMPMERQDPNPDWNIMDMRALAEKRRHRCVAQQLQALSSCHCKNYWLARQLLQPQSLWVVGESFDKSQNWRSNVLAAATYTPDY